MSISVNDVVGGRDAQIETTIAARAADEQAVPVSLSADKHAVHIGVGASDVKDANATIWLFRVQPQATVAITDGENKGHTYTYHNVVRRWIKVGTWTGEEKSWTVPRGDFARDDADAVTVLVQAGNPENPGLMLGAATTPLR